MPRLFFALTVVVAFGWGALPLAAESPAVPLPSTEREGEPCISVVDEQRLIEEQRRAHRRRILAGLERTYGRQLDEALSDRLRALEIGQQRGEEFLAFARAMRATRECLAEEQREPFCDALFHKNAEACVLVPHRSGPVFPDSCRHFVSFRAAITEGDPARCDPMGDFAGLCRQVVLGELDCDALSGSDQQPGRGLCRLLSSPSRCAHEGAPEEEPCALVAFIKAMQGVEGACARISKSAFPRLAGACPMVASGGEAACPPSAGSGIALVGCVEFEPWPPEMSRRGETLVVRVAVANVLKPAADCTIGFVSDEADEQLSLEPISLDPLDGGRATVQTFNIALPDGTTTLPRAEVSCTWRRHRIRTGRSDVAVGATLTRFGGPSLDHPGDGGRPVE